MEETVEAPENGESEEIAAPSDEENNDTEGDDISNEDPTEEDPATEEPSEEEVVEPSTEDEDDSTITTNEAEVMEEKTLASPVITLKQGDKTINSGTKVPHTADIKFEITPVENVTFKYAFGDTAPTKTTGTEYNGSVAVTPDKTSETTVTIQAIAIKAATEDDPEQISDAATATVTFEAKKKVVMLDAGNPTAATIKAGTVTIDSTTGMEYDPSKALALTVELDENVSATQEIDKVQYKNAEDADADWKDAKAETNGTYTIPQTDLTTDILVKATLKNMPVLTFDLDEKSTYGMFTVKLTVKKGSKTLKNNEVLNLAADKKTVSVPSGTVVTANITAKTKCTLVEVTLDGNAVTLAANKTSANVNVSTAQAPMAANATIKVTADEDYLKAVVAPKEENKGTATESKAKTWSVAPRFDYIISAKAGGDGDFMIGMADAEIEGVTLTQITKKVEEEDVPTGTYELKVLEKDAGTNFTVKLYRDAEGKDLLDTITISVAPAITKVTVAKATGADKDQLSQMIGTTAEYALTLDTKEKTSTDVLNAVVAADANPDGFIKNVSVKDNKTLVIETSLVDPNATAVKVNIVNTSADDSAKAIKVLEVSPAVLTWDKANKGGIAPTVKADNTGATDTELKLNMTVPKGVTVDENSEYYYVVKATPVAKDESKSDYIEVERYYKATGNTMSQLVPVINAEFGGGRSEKFNVTVELRQYVKTNVPAQQDDDPIADSTAPTSTLIATSKAAEVKSVATKEPYYADKITLKKAKAASGIYTGQTESVATIDFGKNTTYNRDGDVTVEVVGQTATGDDNIIKPVIANSTVKLTVGKNVKPGKYNICVTQKVRAEDATDDYGIPAGAKPTSATLQVTVVQGIKSIELTAQPDIYVSGKTAGTAKIAVTYNGGKNEDKPKTAKVTYELGVVDGSDFKTDSTQQSEIEKWVTVNNNNGAVTVKKGYNGEITSNKFAVRAKAADFAANDTVSNYKEFTITNAAKTLGDIVIVQADANDNTKFKPLEPNAKNVVEIKADELASTYVRVLVAPKDGDAEKTEYTAADFEGATKYDLTLSNKKDVSVNSNFSLSATKVVNNVTVSAVANDGGKQKAPNSGKVKFSITYADVDHDKAKLQIKKGTENGTFTDFDTKNEFVADGSSAKQVYTVIAMEDETALNGKLVDYKITAGKGAKIVKAEFPEAQVMMTADVATLNLVGPKGTTAKVYTIKNDVLAKKTTAPKITLAKNQKIYANYGISRNVTFTVAKGTVKDANKIVITAEQDNDSKALFGTLNTKSIDLSTAENDGKLVLSADKTAEINLEFAANVPVIKSATLYFDFVKETEVEDEEGNKSKTETVLTKAPASVKLKTEVLKKSYKLNTKYTMSAKDLAKVPLTASGKTDGNPKVSFTGLLNANIGGKINKFTGTGNAFDLSGDMLVLKNPALAINDKKTKENNLTGFVKYTVTYDDGSQDKDLITQITVTIKDKPVQTLKATKATVLAEENISTTITVMAGKNAVELAVVEYVANDASKGGDAKIKSTDIKDGDKKGEVTLSYDGTPNVGTFKGTLYVVPADSYYAEKAAAAYTASKTPVASLADENEMTWADYKDKGIAIAVPVDFVVKKLDDKSKKISIDSKSLKLVYEKNDDVTVSGKNYTLNVPFTFATQATLDTEDPVTIVANPKNPDWVSVQKVSGENKIAVTIDKDAYAIAVKKSLKNNKYLANGTKVSVTVQFNFKDATVADTFKLDITPMKLTDDEIDEAKVPVAKEVTITNPANATIKKGTETTLAATVTGDNLSTEQTTAVEWSIKEQNTNAGTKIEGEKLTIATEEELNEITIVASSKVMKEDGKPATAELKITLEPAEETP